MRSGRQRKERRKARQQAAAAQANDSAKIPESALMDAGGQGEVTRGDIAVVRTAVNGAYPIDPALRERIVSKMDETLDASNPRERIGAAKVLLSADKLNAHASRGPEQHQHLHQHAGGASTGEACPTCGSICQKCGTNRMSREEHVARIDRIREQLGISREAVAAELEKREAAEPGVVIIQREDFFRNRAHDVQRAKNRIEHGRGMWVWGDAVRSIDRFRQSVRTVTRKR